MNILVLTAILFFEKIGFFFLVGKKISYFLKEESTIIYF